MGKAVKALAWRKWRLRWRNAWTEVAFFLRPNIVRAPQEYLAPRLHKNGITMHWNRKRGGDFGGLGRFPCRVYICITCQDDYL